MDETSLKQMIQRMAQHGRAALVQGKVIYEKPLKIQISNDSKLVISERIAIIPKHLTDYEAEMDLVWKVDTSVSSTTAAGDALVDFNLFKAKAIVRNGLKLGEKVHLLVLQNGKLYYVLDRVE